MKNKKVSKRKVVNIVSVIVIILSVLTIGASAFMVWQPFKEEGNAPVTQKANKTSEAAWDGSFSNFLVCGIDKTMHLTDVIMVVGFNNKTGEINVLQIPRDTYAGSDISTYKYNAVYGSSKKYSGMENLKSHVEEDFGIKIDHYLSITTTGLDKLVDAAGGVDLTVPMTMNYDDPYQDLHIHLKKGYQHLNGSQAEQLVRYRHGYAEGDIGRLDTQKLFLAAFASKLKNMNKLELTAKVLPVLMSKSNFTTDMNGLALVQFGLAAQKINMNNVNVQTMPGEPFTYNGTSLYSVHKIELLALLNKYFVPDGVVLDESDLAIVQKADKYDDYNKSGDNFDDIIKKQSGKATSSASSSSDSSSKTSS